MSARTSMAKPGELRGVHVFWIIFSFFAVIIAVNVIFISRALGSFPGEDEMNSYVQGNDYNATLARRAAQARLGWTAQVGAEAAGAGTRLVVRLAGASAQPVAGRRIEANWRVVGQTPDEQTVRLQESAPGEYAAVIAAHGPGRLAVKTEVKDETGATLFEAVKTLTLP